MKTIKLEDYMYKVFTLFWVDNLENETAIAKKFVKDLLSDSYIEIKEGNIKISKVAAIKENENDIIGVGVKESIELIDKELNIPKYTVFYYKPNVSNNIDYGLKSFNKLKDAEEEIKEIFYDKSDYAFLLKGLNSVIYRLVTKDSDGLSEPVYINQELGRYNKLFIQYYDND